ncbi:MAG: hypothetical protein PHF29_07840 [Candidatus Riflebacteria bacterium]|nr:hypothetical protein [Candidatus Riflebacteria bacterium]
MSNRRSDELSLSMRIPASRCYLENALLTLDGICEHCSVAEKSTVRVRKALQAALSESLEIASKKNQGLFDLKFSVSRDRMDITVENYILSDNKEDIEELDSEVIEAKLAFVSSLADGYKYLKDNRQKSSFSMQFNLEIN